MTDKGGGVSTKLLIFETQDKNITKKIIFVYVFHEDKRQEIRFLPVWVYEWWKIDIRFTLFWFTLDAHSQISIAAKNILLLS